MRDLNSKVDPLDHSDRECHSQGRAEFKDIKVKFPLLCNLLHEAFRKEDEFERIFAHITNFDT